ncbi:MAG TPA: GNAT family N-acetyltransferase [Candidatus Hydrogenedentes bacterium]|nr:GNAT family N-acetyltransferase [Candidatus Hydrogenedentota bacterium]
MTEYDAVLEAYRAHPLDVFFKPRSVAVIGATEKENSVGRRVFQNLVNHPFGGTVYPVNLNRRHVLGIRAFPEVGKLPETPDLAVIITPAETVPGVLDQCGRAGVKGAIIISAGFNERGERGKHLEGEIRELARRHGIRVIGPNSLGIMNPVTGLNAAYASAMPYRGTVGFISQSGAISAAVLDWSLQAKTGFSAFVSFGSMVDVQWSDVIYYLGSDPSTRSIVIYLESMGDVRSFLSAAREVSLSKPVILLRAGRTPQGSRAAQSSPYACVDECDDEVLNAALTRCGVLRVDDVEMLFAMADTLSKQPRPSGPSMAIVGNAMAPCVLAVDALVGNGGTLARLSETTLTRLNAAMPPYWNRHNPLDIMGDADPERYANAVEIALSDEHTHGVLVIFTPQVNADPEQAARRISKVVKSKSKPVLASWMGGESVQRGAEILQENNIPVFAYPDTATRVFCSMWRYTRNLWSVYETPQTIPATEPFAEARSITMEILNRAWQEDRRVLTDTETKRILSVYGLPVIETETAGSMNEVEDLLSRVAYPIALYADYPSPTCPINERVEENIFVSREEALNAARNILNQGKKENLPVNRVCVRKVVRASGYRVILASRVDKQFGPYLYFGAGGPLSKVLRDYAAALPPVTTTLARRTMERCRIYQALKGEKGSMAVNTEEIEVLMVRFGDLIVDQPWITEIEINPLYVTVDQAVVLQCSAVILPRETPRELLPRPVIRPYPSEYVFQVETRDGKPMIIRPVRPEDEIRMIRFHKTLSSDTVYFRYLRLLSLDQRIRHDRLSQMCFVDYDRQMGLVATTRSDRQSDEDILAICRFVRLPDGKNADFAVVVSDLYQGKGIGRLIMEHLIRIAKAEGLERLTGIIHPENTPMLHLCGKVGFNLSKDPGGEVVAVLDLTRKNE